MTVKPQYRCCRVGTTVSWRVLSLSITKRLPKFPLNLVAITFANLCLVPVIAVAQPEASSEQTTAPSVASTGAEITPNPEVVEVPAEAASNPADVPAVTPEPAPVASTDAVAVPSATPAVSTVEQVDPATSPGDDVDGPGTHVAIMDAWFGLVANQAEVNGVNPKALGGAFGIRVCLLCILFADSPITGGDLIGFDLGLGYQSPENKSLGSAWALLRLDLGLQVAARPIKDLELVLRYFVISQWNSVRDIGSSDDTYVLEPGFRYQQWLVDAGFGVKLFGYPLMTDRGRTASLLSLRARYLLDMKKGYFVGVGYEHMASPSGGVDVYSSNVIRLMLGQQI
jgi:hypothetical protein